MPADFSPGPVRSASRSSVPIAARRRHRPLDHRHRDALRTEVAGGEVGGKIYAVGGFGGERELEVYDPAVDRWNRGASIARALHHAAAVGLNDKPYVVGGFVEGWTPTDDVHEYDPASDRWHGSPPCPHRAARWRLLCSVADPRSWWRRLAGRQHPIKIWPRAGPRFPPSLMHAGRNQTRRSARSRLGGRDLRLAMRAGSD
jgi:hypothetical protein